MLAALGVIVPVFWILYSVPGWLELGNEFTWCFRGGVLLISGLAVLGIVPGLVFGGHWCCELTPEVLMWKCPRPSYGESHTVSVSDIKEFVIFAMDMDGSPDFIIRTKEGTDLKMRPTVLSNYTDLLGPLLRVQKELVIVVVEVRGMKLSLYEESALLRICGYRNVVHVSSTKAMLAKGDMRRGYSDVKEKASGLGRG